MLIDCGKGTPVVLVPGIQGRWEWHVAAVEALAADCRVLTFSFADEVGDNRFDATSCVDSYCQQILDVVAQAGLKTVTLCGISYGGLIAAVFAARYPDKVSALVLVSALPPTWKPDARIGFYLRAPRLLTPVFLAASLRLFIEIRRASPGFTAAVTTGIRHAWNAITHMFSPTRMARRAVQLAFSDYGSEVARIQAPTLIVTGEAGLDRVVPVAATLDYLRLVPQARVVTLARTGHLGSVTRPQLFAELVVPFATQGTTSTDSRRHIG
jgi:pimeloyl-ACP methyl ester carboxylesterase